MIVIPLAPMVVPFDESAYETAKITKNAKEEQIEPQWVELISIPYVHLYVFENARGNRVGTARLRVNR